MLADGVHQGPSAQTASRIIALAIIHNFHQQTLGILGL